MERGALTRTLLRACLDFVATFDYDRRRRAGTVGILRDFEATETHKETANDGTIQPMAHRRWVRTSILSPVCAAQIQVHRQPRERV